MSNNPPNTNMRVGKEYNNDTQAVPPFSVDAVKDGGRAPWCVPIVDSGAFPILVTAVVEWEGTMVATGCTACSWNEAAVCKNTYTCISSVLQRTREDPFTPCIKLPVRKLISRPKILHIPYLPD